MLRRRTGGGWVGESAKREDLWTLCFLTTLEADVAALAAPWVDAVWRGGCADVALRGFTAAE